MLCSCVCGRVCVRERVCTRVSARVEHVRVGVGVSAYVHTNVRCVRASVSVRDTRVCTRIVDHMLLVGREPYALRNCTRCPALGQQRTVSTEALQGEQGDMCLIGGPVRWEEGGFGAPGLGIGRLGRKSPRAVTGRRGSMQGGAGPTGSVSRGGGFVLTVSAPFRRLKIKASGSR